MNRLLVLTLLFFTFPCATCGQADDACSAFRKLVKQTYNFKPSKLSESEQNVKSSEMDKVWNTVKAKPKALVPCLRAELEAPDADLWFRFNGSMLLVEVDPVPSAKALQARNLSVVDLDDVDLRSWIRMATRLGLDGFDVSEAGARWLAYPQARYSLPEHGGFVVNNALGAFFIYGSMDEAHATPALNKIANGVGHPGRETAIALLTKQATPEALRELKRIDQTGLSERARRFLQLAINEPQRLQPRAKPKSTREDFLRAFNGIVQGDWEQFLALTEEVPDGEKDVIAVMKPEDVPLIRKVRRKIIAGGNQHAVEYYESFTQILLALIQTPGVMKTF